MTSAAITPGTQPHRVSRVVMIRDPHPLSKTARGGNITAKITLKMLIVVHLVDWLTVFLSRLVSAYRRRALLFRPRKI